MNIKKITNTNSISQIDYIPDFIFK